MKMTARKIAEAYAATRVLAGIALPGLVAYKVKKISQALKTVSDAYSEGRDAIIKEFGAPNADAPGTFRIPPEKVEQFEAAMKELDNKEEKISFGEPLFVHELSKVEIQATVFEALDLVIMERPGAP